YRLRGILFFFKQKTAYELNMGQGANQATGVGTDLMIAGDGFFTVMKNGAVSYTRSGAFHLDNEGHLVTSDGALVSGVDASTGSLGLHPVYPAPPTALDLSPLLNGYNPGPPLAPVYGPPGTPPGTGSFVSYTIDSAGKVNAVTDTGDVVTLGQLTLTTFPN